MALTSQLSTSLLQVDGRLTEGGVIEIVPGARLLLDVGVENVEPGALLDDIAAAVAEAKAARDAAQAVAGADTAGDLIAAVDADPETPFRQQQDARLAATFARGSDASNYRGFGAPQHEEGATYTYPTRLDFGTVNPAPIAAAKGGTGLDVIAHWYNDFGIEYVASSSSEANGWHGWYDWRWNFPTNGGDGDTTLGYDTARHPIQGFYQGDSPDVLDWQAYWLAEAGVTAVSLINSQGVDPTTWATPSAPDHWMYQFLTNAPNARSLRWLLSLKPSGTTAAIEAQNDAVVNAYASIPGAYTINEQGRSYAAVFVWDLESIRGVYDAHLGQAATVAYLKALAAKFRAVGFDGVAALARNSGLVYASPDPSLRDAGVLVLDAGYEQRYGTDASYGNSYATYASTADFITDPDHIVNVVTSAESAFPHPSGFNLAGSTPEAFRTILARAADSIARNGQRPIVTIYNVAEWAEGGPGLIPQKRDGFAYLDAVRALAPRHQPTPVPDGEVLIERRRLDTNAASVVFDDIPTWARSVRIVFHGSANIGHIFAMRVNNDTGANYDTQGTVSAGTTATHAEYLGQTEARIGETSASSGLGGTCEIVLDVNASSTFYRSFLVRGMRPDATTAGNFKMTQFVGSWRNNAAVTRVDLYPGGGGSWRSGSSFALYATP